MTSPNTTLPNWNVPLIDPDTGATHQAWFSYFAGLAAQPGPIVVVNPISSPFSYTASQNGSLSISGGSVTSIVLTRARVSATLGMTSGTVTLSQGDVVTIKYTSAPTLHFIPS